MFGLSHALCLSANSPTSNSTPRGTTAFQPASAQSMPHFFSRITPLSLGQRQSIRQLAPQAGLRASNGDADLRAVAKPQAIFSARDRFIPEGGAMFYANVQQQGAPTMTDNTEKTTQSSQGEGTKAPGLIRPQNTIALDSETIGEQTRVMISIGKDLQGQPLSAIGQALTSCLQSSERGFQNMQVTVTQHLSPTVVVAELSQPSSEKEATAEDAGCAEQSPKAPVATRPAGDFLRVRVTAAVNSLQHCQGVLAIESDHKVQQRPNTKDQY